MAVHWEWYIAGKLGVVVSGLGGERFLAVSLGRYIAGILGIRIQ